MSKYASYVATLALGWGVVAGPLAAQEPAAKPAAEATLQMNFKDAEIRTVLDYLSKTAGFVIVQSGTVSGKVDIMSHQPLSPDEAVSVLENVLQDRGYGVVRDGRILRIVKRSEARLHDLPVRSGSDPASVPKNGELVTQIVPIRYATASKLLETLKPLIPPDSTVTASDDSNALVITDTQTNIRRMMEIVKALDTTVSSILEIQVVALKYADPEATAELINKIYEAPSGTSGQTQDTPRFGRRGGFGGFGGGGGDAPAAETPNDARKTSTHINAVADVHSNAVVITAPAEAQTQIRQLLTQIDVPNEAATVVRTFGLRYASAADIATIVTNLYGQSGGSGSGAAASTDAASQGGGRGSFFRRMAQAAEAPTTPERKVGQATVTAVADARTNSVVVTASPETMEEIAGIVSRLDETPANVPSVYIYRLNNADVARAKEILESMFDDLESTGSTTGTTAPTAGGTGRTATTGRASATGGAAAATNGAARGTQQQTR